MASATRIEFVSSAEPPYETSGSGIPITGISPIVIPMLMRRWTRKIPATPVANTFGNVWAAQLPRLESRMRRYPKIPSSTIEPMNPHSSAMIVNTKSVDCSGMKASWVCVPSMNPFPRRPPEPIAAFDWMTWKPEVSRNASGFVNATIRSIWWGWSTFVSPIHAAIAVTVVNASDAVVIHLSRVITSIAAVNSRAKIMA